MQSVEQQKTLPLTAVCSYARALTLLPDASLASGILLPIGVP